MAGRHGAIFALVKAAVDRGAAEGTRRLTGTWPGDEGQQPDNERGGQQDAGREGPPGAWTRRQAPTIPLTLAA